MLLEQKNKHERDKFISIDDNFAENHIYWVKDSNDYMSVSRLYERYFPKFDGDFTIKSLYSQWQKNPRHKYYGMSIEEIKLQWKTKNKIALNKGTFIHELIENHMNGEKVSNSSPEYLQYLNFIAKNEQLIPYRSEWRVYDEKYKVVGSIDAVYKKGDKYVIIDFKTNEQIRRQGFNGERALEPFTHLENCEFDKYSLQLSVYRYILEEKYGIEIEDNYLLWLSDKNNSAQLILLPYLKNEVKYMLYERFKEINV